MIIAELKGGMGNQMFQYAFGKYLASKHNTVLKLDTYFLLDRTTREKNFTFRDYDLNIFDLDAEFATIGEVRNMTHWVFQDFLNKGVRKIFGRKKSLIIEPHSHFSEHSFSAPDNVYLEGYWQSEKYFEPIKDVIKKTFVVKDDLQNNSKTLIEEIKSKNSVCVNIRRGDFVINNFHGLCDATYYALGEKIIVAKISDPHFFVFSDEIDWCIKNLSFLVPATFVSEEFAGKQFQDKFRLMSACKHFIIPNSSFAWWATYLNDNPGKIVIVPKKWVSDEKMRYDIYPENWIKI